MKLDLRSIVTRVAKFLEESFSEELIDTIVENCTLDRMQKSVNESMKNFLSMSADELKSDEKIPDHMKKCYLPLFESKDRYLPPDWKFVRKGGIYAIHNF